MRNLEIKRGIKYWLPVLVWAYIIFLFSSRPTGMASEIHWEDFIIKKTAHIIEYGVLSLVVYRASRSEGVSKKKAGIYSIIFSIFYGFTDEFHQSFTPGREPRLRDTFFDTIGASFAIYFIWKLLPKTPKKLKILAEKLEIS